jgi:hypothetical protein
MSDVNEPRVNEYDVRKLAYLAVAVGSKGDTFVTGNILSFQLW